jgi:hypothetical protein
VELPSGQDPSGAPGRLFDPDPELQDLPSAQLLAMVAATGRSVLRRGRALMELGRRASSDTMLLQQTAALIRDPANQRSITAGTVTVSQLGAAGLIAGGSEPAAALARELAAQWPPGERSDFAWLISSLRAAYPPQD